MENLNVESNENQDSSDNVTSENTEQNQQQLTSSKDWLLQGLVDLSNKNGLRITITLNVGGTLISGLLISGEEYFELLAQSLEQTGVLENLVEQIRQLSKIVYGEESGDTQNDLPSYIHLKNTKFYNSARGLPTDGVALWRGKINSVDGFFIGAFHDTISDSSKDSE
jgi:hypothetical protein